jgi:outer membrane protein assembly factor BamD
MLRNTQEVLADKEFRTGDFYHHRGSFPAAANRLAYVTQQYPLYSSSDDALWELADAYGHMGDRFKNPEADALTKLVREYPLSDRVDAAKKLLTDMERPVPEADPVAYAHMKYELENRSRPGIVHRAIGPFVSHPETYLAAKSGTPAMQSMRPPVPVSVPATAAGGQNGISDVTAGVVGNTEAIDKQPEARLGQPAAGTTAENTLTGTGEQRASLGSNGQSAAPAATTPAPAEANQPLPTNHPPTKAQLQAYRKAQEKAAKQAKKKADAAKPASTPATTPASTATPATTTPAQ